MKGNTVEKEIPTTKTKTPKNPSPKQKEKDMPVVGNANNIVMFNDMPIEIKPTKLKYHRNHTAAFYQIVDNYPLSVILTMDDTMFGDGRDGDKCLLDWLVAVFDDEEFVVNNYNDMDAEFIEKTLEIFKRINHIDEKEEKLKKLQTPQKEE